jgi:membrane protein
MAHALNTGRQSRLKIPWQVLSGAVEGWFRDRCVSNAASVAFFALFSLAPMLILVVTVASYGLKSADVVNQIFSQLQQTIGETAAMAIKETVSKANLSEWGSSATVASLIITMIGASATFIELKAALNSIFLGPPKQDAPFAHATWAYLRARILSGALVLGIGMILIVAVIAEGIASFFVPHITPSLLAILHPLISALNLVHFDTFTSVGLLTAASTVLLVVLPDTKILWKDALIGALVGTVLFVAGKYAFGLYLKVAGTANAFGAAGSAVVTLMWIFYSAAVFLFSAEVLKELQKINSINLLISPQQQLS